MFATWTKRSGYVALTLVLLALASVSILLAQNAAKVTALDPTMGKADDTVTVTGENLGKDNVAAVFLSDDNDDFKATLVEQAADKIVMKVPKTKAGRYSLSIQIKDRILILPIKFEVTQ
jgi:IPT/TIG domain-containing protein